MCIMRVSAKQRRTHSMDRLRRFAALLALAAAAASSESRIPVSAQAEHGDHAGGGTFGSVHFDNSCSAGAQKQFDRAVAMLHSFFYPETEKAFRAIVEQEPACAMGY